MRRGQHGHPSSSRAARRFEQPNAPQSLGAPANAGFVNLWAFACGWSWRRPRARKCRLQAGLTVEGLLMLFWMSLGKWSKFGGA
eukprot:10806718-Alexandrium_andersonii.AAC.1